MPAVAADANRPPLRPGTLAAVSAIMCHTDIDDYAAALRSLSPALRPGGVFAHVGVHPCYTGAFADRSDPAQVLISRATGGGNAASTPGRRTESGPGSGRRTSP